MQLALDRRRPEQLSVLAVRHFFRRATEQAESAISATRAAAQRVTRYLQAVAEALRPASRAFRDDLARFAPAAEIYEQNTAAAAVRVRELIDEGTPVRGVPERPHRLRRRGRHGDHAPDHERRDHCGDRAERRRGVRGSGPPGGGGGPALTRALSCPGGVRPAAPR